RSSLYGGSLYGGSTLDRTNTTPPDQHRRNLTILYAFYQARLSSFRNVLKFLLSTTKYNCQVIVLFLRKFVILGFRYKEVRCIKDN
ncbi:hypothetical protein BpHYR1_042054, partial [Brachionus plicatilis]